MESKVSGTLRIVAFMIVGIMCGVGNLKGSIIGDEYRLKKVVEVPGRQGIAADSVFYYVSDTKAIYKYDKNWHLINVNRQPFVNPEVANHFGDIDVWNGEIYCGIERFEYGRGYNIAVSIYDAETGSSRNGGAWILRKVLNLRYENRRCNMDVPARGHGRTI